MFRKSLTTALAATAALALALPAASSGASTSAAGHLRVALDTNAEWSNPTLTAQRHNYVILQPWQTDRLAQIKAESPSTMVICHKNLSGAVNAGSGGIYSSGLSTQQIDSSHPEWFLKDSSGSRITFIGYNWLYGMDVGSRGYQDAWAAAVIDELKRNGWDGVLMDNTDTTMQYDFASYPTKYPNDAAWQAATESALANIGPKIQAAGKLAIPNIGGWGGHPAVGNSWLQYVSGGMDEMFTKWGTSAGSGYADEGRWKAALDSLKYTQQQGKPFLAVSHSSATDQQAAIYGWATVLLGANGRASFTMAPNYTKETWFPQYDYDLGDPSGAETRASNGVHRRVFTNGVVVVNPTTSAADAALGGTYSGSGYTDVTSVRLAPHSAAILTGTPPPTEPPPTDTTIVPGKKHVKRGKVVAGGSVTTTESPAKRAGDRHVLRIELWRRGDRYRRTRARVRSDGTFSAKLRVCHRGRYRIVATDLTTNERAKWPKRLRVRKNDLRC
jgi:hypothetical protein